jgi:hypothetical protein
MSHLKLAFYLLSLMLASASLSQTALMWWRYRKVVLRRYACFLAALTLIFLDAATSYTQLPGGLQFLNDMAQPAYFLVLNALSLVFGLKHLNRHPRPRTTSTASIVLYAPLMRLGVAFHTILTRCSPVSNTEASIYPCAGLSAREVP